MRKAGVKGRDCKAKQGCIKSPGEQMQFQAGKKKDTNGFMQSAKIHLPSHHRQ
jgi:hypothetical protein